MMPGEFAARLSAFPEEEPDEIDLAMLVEAESVNDDSVMSLDDFNLAGTNMSAVKERLLGAITVMDDATAVRLWDIAVGMVEPAWDSIEEVEPDDADLQMIQDAEEDPECRIFD